MVRFLTRLFDGFRAGKLHQKCARKAAPECGARSIEIRSRSDGKSKQDRTSKRVDSDAELTCGRLLFLAAKRRRSDARFRTPILRVRACLGSRQKQYAYLRMMFDARATASIRSDGQRHDAEITVLGQLSGLNS